MQNNKDRRKKKQNISAIFIHAYVYDEVSVPERFTSEYTHSMGLSSDFPSDSLFSLKLLIAEYFMSS